MKYLTSISEQELSACLAQTEDAVSLHQKKWRLQVIAFFCAIALLGSVVLLQTGKLFPGLWANHSHMVVMGFLLVLAVIMFTSVFVNAHLHGEHQVPKDHQDHNDQVNYNIDITDNGLSVLTVSDTSQEKIQYFWAAIKRVYLFNNAVMILGYAKAKESLLLPFNEPSLQAMQDLVEEMRMHLPSSIFVVGAEISQD